MAGLKMTFRHVALYAIAQCPDALGSKGNDDTCT